MAKKSKADKQVSANSITLADSAGRPRAILGLIGPDESPMLQFYDREGRPRIVIQVQPSGHAVIALHGEQGATLAGIGTDDGGDISIGINRSDAAPVLRVRCEKNEELHVSLWDKSGRLMWQSFGRTETPGGQPPDADQS